MSTDDVLGRPGVLVPPMTPFDADGTVRPEKLPAQVDYIVEECRATAVEALAVEAQEYRALDPAEREAVIRATADAVDARVPLVVGVSSPSTRQAARLGDVARDVDADAVQALIPRRIQGGTTDIGELTAYFEGLGDRIDLPIVAYHNPGPGADLGPDGLRRLAELDEVVAFKESSRNLRHVLRTVELVDRAGLADYYTTMEMLLVTLLLGGSGATMPAPPAGIAAALIEAVEGGDIDAAVAYQREFAEFPARWLDAGLCTVMKAALDHVGIDAGVPYPPATPVGGGDLDALHDHLDTLSLP